MSKLKTFLGISAIAGAIGALFAYKKKREMEEYEYEDFDECYCDDCCYPDEETAEKAINEAAENSSDDTDDSSEDTTESAVEEADESIAPEAEADQAEE